MFLDSLSHHIPAQKRAIRQASSGFKSSSTWYAPWEGFRKSLWGKPLGSFETEKLVERDGTVSDVALPGTHGVATVPETLPPGLFQGRQILVRSECKDVEEAAVSLSGTGLDALVASGQHGIGKSGFLIRRLLMRRLALELPTVLQIRSSHAILFHEGEYFYMKPWSDVEVLQVRPFLNKNCSKNQLWYLHKEFGASPRDLSKYARKPDAYKSLLIRQTLSVIPAPLRDIVQDPGFHEISHRFISIGPSEDDREIFEKRFISQKVFDLFWDIHIRHHTSEIAHFYDPFKATPGAKVAAGWLFEARMHQFLARDTTIRLFPIRHRRAPVNLIYGNYASSTNPMNQENFQLAWSEQHVLPEDGSVELQEGCYYRPTPDNFPTIDSLLLHPTGDPSPTFLMFQITDGLWFPSNTRKILVVVTPEDVRPKLTIPKKYFEERRLSPKKFKVLHYSVSHLFRVYVQLEDILMTGQIMC